ncbi:hypothetical protein ABBQ38_014411 [Trebouxia sp. C0009 RCD-2024]
MSSDGCLLPCVASPQDVADRLHNQTERVLEVTETIRQLCQSQNLGLAQVPRGVMALAAPVLWLMASEVSKQQWQTLALEVREAVQPTDVGHAIFQDLTGRLPS